MREALSQQHIILFHFILYDLVMHHEATHILEKKIQPLQNLQYEWLVEQGKK